MKLNNLIKPLLNERGQIEGPLISGLLSGLFGLFGGEPRGAQEFSSMQRRAARAEAAEEGGRRSIRDALIQRAMASAFGISPLDQEIASLEQASRTASGKFASMLNTQIQALRRVKAGELRPEQLESEFGFTELADRVKAGQQIGSPESLGPFRTRLLPSERETLENQFRQAELQTIGTTGQRGGHLSKSLADLAIERARTISGAEIDAAERGKRLALSLIAPAAFQESGEATAIGSVLRDIRGQEAGTANAMLQGGMGIGALIQQIMKERNPKPSTTVNIGPSATATTSTPLLGSSGLFVDNESLKRLLGLRRPDLLSA